MKQRIKVLLVGGGGREDVIAKTLSGSRNYRVEIYAYMERLNPSIAMLAKRTEIGRIDDIKRIVDFAENVGGIFFAIIGPEKPLAAGLANALIAIGILCVGPKKDPAQIETSKVFARELLKKYSIPGNPHYLICRRFLDLSFFNVEYFMDSCENGMVIKPDGLTGGKGVMVQGDHFQTKAEALAICATMFESHSAIILEEKLNGEKFSLQCFVDGETVIPMPPVQDHKRRFVFDQGLNTGGMGSYSCADHSLPFLRQTDILQATEIVRQTVLAIKEETGEFFRGILYGGFMATADGVKLIEFNARFGDPEAMNVLPLLETDFVDLCLYIISGRLNVAKIAFQKKATVVRYLVTPWYGRELPSGKIMTGRIVVCDPGEARLYYASVVDEPDGMYPASPTCRILAVLGIGDSLPAAVKIIEQAKIGGDFDCRPDIGTDELIKRRVDHMRRLRGG